MKKSHALSGQLLTSIYTFFMIAALGLTVLSCSDDGDGETTEGETTEGETTEGETTETDPCADSDLTVSGLGTDGTLSFTISGGETPYSYSVSYEGNGTPQTGETSESSVSLTADEPAAAGAKGAATITITDDNGCEATASVSAEDLNSFIDTRDNQKYKMVTIGEQIWMAENFNYETQSSACYDDLVSNCDIYGRLYNWAEATSEELAPEGWSLPSNDQIDDLKVFLGDNPGTQLIVGGSSGFEAQYGGAKTDEFLLLGQSGIFWTSTGASNPIEAFQYTVDVSITDIENIFSNDKTYLLSVRFIRD